MMYKLTPFLFCYLLLVVCRPAPGLNIHKTKKTNVIYNHVYVLKCTVVNTINAINTVNTINTVSIITIIFVLSKRVHHKLTVVQPFM